MLQITEEEYLEDVLLKLVGNPVHVFSLLDRMVNILPKITSVNTLLENEIQRIVSGEDIVLPDKMDVEGATQALVRIQFAYRLALTLFD